MQISRCDLYYGRLTGGGALSGRYSVEDHLVRQILKKKKNTGKLLNTAMRSVIAQYHGRNVLRGADMRTIQVYTNNIITALNT